MGGGRWRGGGGGLMDWLHGSKQEFRSILILFILFLSHDILKIVDQCIKFYSQNTNLLPPKPKSTFRHLKQGSQDFYRKYGLVPADKAAKNVVVLWRLHYSNFFKEELSGTMAFKETSEKEKSVMNGYCNHLALKFSVCVKECQDRLPTMCWLPTCVSFKKDRIKHDFFLQTQVLVLQLNFLNY